MSNFPRKRYKGIRFNVISVRRVGGGGLKFPEKTLHNTSVLCSHDQ